MTDGVYFCLRGRDDEIVLYPSLSENVCCSRKDTKIDQTRRELLCLALHQQINDLPSVALMLGGNDTLRPIILHFAA
jgi:hypothetical protein